jgi:DnaJ-domain-containing protein 1
VTTRRAGDTGGDPVIDARDDSVTILLDGASTTAQREAQYREWVERMRVKRETARQRIRGTATEPETPNYWRTEDVFRESERVANEDLGRRPDPIVVSEMLAVLGLENGASAREIEGAYRRLAKEHHPDHHVSDDEPTRAHHADQMRRINEAYGRLRQLESA